MFISNQITYQPVMSKSTSGDEFRKELREALDKMRRELQNLRKDVTTTTKTWAKTSGKIVQDVTPKVSATIDDTVQQTSEAFRKTMVVAGRETRQFELSFLRKYRTVLEKQIDLLDKRLKELTK